MQREIRMVPPNWQHPRNKRGKLQPMYDECFEERFERWLADFDRIRAGALNRYERKSYPSKVPLAQWLHEEGMPPDPAFYRPWSDDDAIWFQLWETVSEGTPLTPSFATLAELVDYMVSVGEETGERGVRWKYSREEAQEVVEGRACFTVVIVGVRPGDRDPQTPPTQSERKALGEGHPRRRRLLPS